MIFFLSDSLVSLLLFFRDSLIRIRMKNGSIMQSIGFIIDKQISKNNLRVCKYLNFLHCDQDLFFRLAHSMFSCELT